jgi:ABC-2 type transport system permease protein
MVRILISMRAAMIAHRRSTKFGIVSMIFVIALGLLSVLSTVLLGFVVYPTPADGSNVIAVVMAVWVISRVAYGAFTGGGSTLRLEMFRLLPIRRSRLGRALLIVGLLDPALLFMALAFVGLVALGAQGGLGPALIGAVGVLLTLGLTSILVSMVEAAMPSGSRRRQDAGTMIVAVVISLVAIAGTLLPSLIDALTTGTAPVLSAIVRILPSGWAAAAVDGARSGNVLLSVLPLLGLIALIAVLMRVWPALLSRRLDGALGSSRRDRSRRAGTPLLPQTPTGAVIAKEVRLWMRDPLRLTFLMIAAIIGLGVCVIPEATRGLSVLLPFAGVLTVVIAGAGGCNLYGSDGLAMRLTVMTPHSESADVRGRQLAWLLLVAPYTLCLTVVLTLLSGQTWAWPWALGPLAAVLGGAAGLLPLISLIAVLPLDENGGPAPAWPVKVWATLILTVVSALPAVALLVLGAVTGSPLLQWLSVPVGILTGAALAIGLGSAAQKRLTSHQFDILAQLTAASSPA